MKRSVNIITKRVVLAASLACAISMTACSKDSTGADADTKDILTKFEQGEEESSEETKEIESLWSKESASESRVKLESKLVDGEIELIIPQYNGSSDQRAEYLIDGEKKCDFNFIFPEQITEIETCDYNFDGNVDIVFVGYNHGKKDFWLYRSCVREYEEDTCYFVNDDDIESYVEKE